MAAHEEEDCGKLQFLAGHSEEAWTCSWHPKHQKQVRHAGLNPQHVGPDSEPRLTVSEMG